MLGKEQPGGTDSSALVVLQTPKKECQGGQLELGSIRGARIRDVTVRKMEITSRREGTQPRKEREDKPLGLHPQQVEWEREVEPEEAREE